MCTTSYNSSIHGFINQHKPTHIIASLEGPKVMVVPPVIHSSYQVFVGAFGGTPERLVAYELKRGLAQAECYGWAGPPKRNNGNEGPEVV